MLHHNLHPPYPLTLSRSQARTNLQNIEYIQTPRHDMHHPKSLSGDGLSPIRYQVESGLAQPPKGTTTRTSMDQKQQINVNQEIWAKKRYTIFLRVHIDNLSTPSPFHPPPPSHLLYFDECLFFVIKFLGKWCLRTTARENSSPYVSCRMYLSFARVISFLSYSFCPNQSLQKRRRGNLRFK